MIRTAFRPVITGMLIASLALWPFATTAQAQREPLPEGVPPAGPRVFAVQTAGLRALMPDAKDAALREALLALDERAAELPREITEIAVVPPTAIALVAGLLAEPIQLSVKAPSEGQDADEFHASVLITPGDRQRAADLEPEIRTLLAALGITPTDDVVRGFTRLDSRGGPPVFISSAGETGVNVAIGEPRAPGRLDYPDLPRDVRPSFALEFHAGPLVALAEREGQIDDAYRPFLRELNLLGPTPVEIVLTAGHARDRGEMLLVARNAAPILAALGFGPRRVLSERMLGFIPADVVNAYASGFDLTGFVAAINRIAQIEGETTTAADEFAEATGLDLNDDLLATIGYRAAIYTSDATGGGGPASTVALVELRDPERLARTLESLAQMAQNVIAEEQPDLPLGRYIRVHRWSLDDGAPAATLTFPGLPVPLELSWAMHQDFLVVGFGPHALRAAFDHLRDPGPSILDAPAVREALAGETDPFHSLAYFDTPRLAARGYGLATLGLAALRNAARSPYSLDREPTTPIPSFTDLVAGARPAVTVGRVTGNDVTYHATYDRSVTVELAAAAAQLTLSPAPFLTTPMLLGVLMPAASRSRDAANEVRSASNVRQVVIGAMTYAADNDDRLPDTADQLAPYLEFSSFESPYGPSPDGGSDYVFRAGLGSFAEIGPSAQKVFAVDRAAALAGQERIAMGFLDGHVELVDRDRARSLFEKVPSNEGAAEALGIADWLAGR